MITDLLDDRQSRLDVRRGVESAGILGPGAPSARVRWLPAVLAALAYAAMWTGVSMNSGWVDKIDSWALAEAHSIGVRETGWVGCWEAVSTVTGPPGLRLVMAAAVVFAAVVRNVRAAVLLLTTLALMGALSERVKTLADRPRPASALIETGSTAFPSGHAFGVMTAVLALLTVASGMVGRWVRFLVVTLGVLIVVAVGVSRVMLVVHHPSDVVAGWSLGYLFWFFCHWIIRPPPLRWPVADPHQRRAGPSLDPQLIGPAVTPRWPRA